MQLHKILVPAMALVPAALSAQSTIYSTDFSSGALRTSGTDYNVGDWVLASGKNSTSSAGNGSPSLSSSGLDFGMGATTSGFIETQNRFTATPVTLVNTNDYIQLKIVFTDANNVLGGNSTNAANLAIGLYDSSGNNPAIGLQSSGLNGTAGSPFATGNAAAWEGYLAQLRPSTGTNLINTRPVQNGVNTTSANQDLLFNGVTGGFNNPAPVSVTSAASTLALLSTPAEYTVTFTITKTETADYSISYSLVNASNVELQNVSGTASGGALLADLEFDGLAFGYRYTAPSGQAQVSGLILDSVEVYHFDAAAIPEPSSFAALAGAAGLGLAALRRRRR